MSHPYRTPAPLNKTPPYPPRRPPEVTWVSEDCDCCGWDLPRKIEKTCYWYKYLWCRGCLEHYREELASRGLILGTPAYHSYTWPMHNDHDIEICKSVVQDYHIPAVFYYKYESWEDNLREQHAQLRQEERRIKELNKRNNVFYNAINALHHLVARVMPR